ncbi:FkbM family methyltransferase [Candidatus Pelagibacter sp.]|jgi:FkbM family methyltransferase|nr:FkbM family methyltransferase [Candidatus Pelagibacter sp.]
MLNHFKRYTIPRIYYLFKGKNFFFKILLLYRLLLLGIILILFKRKNFWFHGKFGQKKFKVFLDTRKGSHGTRGYYLLRNKQEPILEFGYKFIKKNDTIIDAGANQGVFSLSFKSQITNEGLIICIEPFDYATKKIKKNFKINNYSNYLIYKKTLSNHNKKNKIYYSNHITDASIVNHKFKKTKITESITIDKIVALNHLNKLNFIKLDIEGAELLAIKGGIKSIKRFKPIIYLEINNSNSFKLIINLMKKIGYRSYIFDEKGNLIQIKKFRKNQNNILLKYLI